MLLLVGIHKKLNLPWTLQPLLKELLWNEGSKSYELVADLDLWKQSIPVERFLSQLTQRYAFNTVLETTAQEGFQIAEQKKNIDGSIELVVTRWDS